METKEAKDLIKVISQLERAISEQTKEYVLIQRKLTTLNDNVGRLADKLGTYNQLIQNK